MTNGNDSIRARLFRAGTALALGMTFAVSVGPVASAQDYDRDHNGYREHDRDYSRRNIGRNRYRYTYGGQNYEYTVDNRRGNMDQREVAERGEQSGYQQGVRDGQYDASGASRRPNPQGHGAYQFGLDGWDQNWGSGLTYQSAYRRGYMRGYSQAFSRSGYRPRRRY